MSTAHTHPSRASDDAAREAGKAAARAAAKASAARVKRARRATVNAQAIPSHVRTVAAGIKLDTNPNRAKRHAAKLDNSPRETPRQYAPGATRASQRHYMPTLETSWARIPSLGTHLSKRPLKGTSRG